jgi:hypothetical protein
MGKIIEVKVLRDDMLVGTLESKSPLFQAFPAGSISVLKPHGKDARSDMALGTLREEWALAEKVPSESYKVAAKAIKEVEINPLGEIGTLRNTMAAALGLPAGALELRLPDKTPANPKSKVTTFLTVWGVRG